MRKEIAGKGGGITEKIGVSNKMKAKQAGVEPYTDEECRQLFFLDKPPSQQANIGEE